MLTENQTTSDPVWKDDDAIDRFLHLAVFAETAALADTLGAIAAEVGIPSVQGKSIPHYFNAQRVAHQDRLFTDLSGLNPGVAARMRQLAALERMLLERKQS